MAFCELKYFSQSLGKAQAANIILPETNRGGPYPVFYLLHGLSDDHTIWMRRTSIERYVQDLPLIVVMPDGGRSFYTDMAEGGAYESSIVKDLIGLIDATFHTKHNREGRVIGGLSMGGYGAAKLALKFPDLFCSAVSHSGALQFGHLPIEAERDPARRAEWKRIVGANPVGGDNDLFALAAKLPADKRPKLRIDCGTEDFLLDSNRAFHKHLETIGFPHEYAEYPGAHTWAYWDVHVQEAIAFHAKALGIKAP
jgi:putative tributyrin esterase